MKAVAISQSQFYLSGRTWRSKISLRFVTQNFPKICHYYMFHAGRYYAILLPV